MNDRNKDKNPATTNNEIKALESATASFHTSVEYRIKLEKIRPSKLEEFVAIFHMPVFYVVFSILVWTYWHWYAFLPILAVASVVWIVGNDFNRWQKDYKDAQILESFSKQLKETVEKLDN